jgi:hypothetical protein
MPLDDSFEKIPRLLDLRVKLAIALPACVVVSVCAWLIKWIGMHPLTLFIMATAIAHVSARFLAPVAARLSPARPSFLRDGRIEARLGRFAQLIAIIAAWVVEYLCARALHVPHPGTGDDPLLLEASLAVLLACSYIGTLIVEVAYSTTTGPTRAGRKAGREGTTAVVLVHGIGNQRPGSTLRPLASSIEQILYRQAPGRVRVTDRPASSGMPAYTEFGYVTRVGRQRRIHSVVLLEAFWADLKPSSQGPRTFSWFMLSLPLLLLLCIAPDYSDANLRSLRRIIYRITYVSIRKWREGIPAGGVTVFVVAPYLLLPGVSRAGAAEPRCAGLRVLRCRARTVPGPGWRVACRRYGRRRRGRR